MKHAPFTLQQGEAIARHYQHLVGKMLDEKNGWVIDCVVVAPADAMNQRLFVHSYLDTGNTLNVRLFYAHTNFEVLLISVYNRAWEQVAFKDIRSYLEAQGDVLSYTYTDDALLQDSHCYYY